MAKKPWYKDGIRFQCQSSGNCCTSRGEYGFVYLTKKDIKRFAEYFELSVAQFKNIYCDQSDGVWHLKERKGESDCMFLVSKKCSAYEARPSQCRTWPFWPDTLDAKSWNKDVKGFCPGVGKGKTVPFKEIERNRLEAEKTDEELVFG